MSHPGKARALLATLRIANAPSVVSNVFLGYMFGWVLCQSIRMAFGDIDWRGGEGIAERPPWILIVAGLLLYFSGNLANDWFDRKWDAEKRPERALPKGMFRPATYLGGSITFAVAGVTLSFSQALPCGVCALVIVALIAIYTRFHKVAIWPVIPMGLCRAGLYFLGFLVWWRGSDELRGAGMLMGSAGGTRVRMISILAVGLFSYVAGLSLSARYEGMQDAPAGPRVTSLAMLFIPIAAMSCQFMPRAPVAGIVGMIPFGIWLALCLTRFRKPIPRYVSALLAGIPLVDFIAAAPMALRMTESVSQDGMGAVFIYPAFAAMLVVPLVAFVLGRALQKLAPAT